MAFLSGYNRRKSITVDADTHISGDLTNQAVVVHLDNGETDFWDNSPPVAGTGVRFTQSDGTTLLKFEVESYDTTGDDGWWHVKIPTLSGSTDTIIYVYYDADSESDGSDKENVWDSNYKGVYHLNQDKSEGAFDDSTSNNADGTNQGTTDALGAIDRGRDWDGTNDYIDIGDTTVMDGATVATFEGWVTLDANVANGVIFRKWTGGQQSYILDTGASGDHLRIAIHDGTNQLLKESTTGTLSTATEYHLVGVWDGGDSARLYVDGSLVTTPTGGSSPTSINNSTENLNLGRHATGNDGLLNGRMDETTMSNTNRSADWVIARYQSGLGTWLTIGATETEPAVGAEPAIFMGCNF